MGALDSNLSWRLQLPRKIGRFGAKSRLEQADYDIGKEDDNKVKENLVGPDDFQNGTMQAKLNAS